MLENDSPEATGLDATAAPTETAEPTETAASETVASETVATEIAATETAASDNAATETAATETAASDTAGKPEAPQKHGFDALSLRDEVRQAVQASGYDQPTPVQAAIIPHMLDGRDVLAQSQTGSGKTAAFALPILSRIDLGVRAPQVLVLAPTRELAIQVTESFSTYASCLPGFAVTTIYGGQDYEPQLRQLRRGVHVIVGTPGRVIDHVNRGTLDLSGIQCLVLDEADEMLNMGFLEDVQFVLERTPDQRQTALFSATLPPPIREIASRYLNDPAKIIMKEKTMTAASIRQRALFVAPRNKIDVLIRLLEVEETDGVIVFTKTKMATMSVAEKLAREGLSAAALNGDMPQKVRERTIELFKSGRLNILVATDVAARGLDVSRVSHVFNFDLPHDSQAYIHRVGRTGRAGRSGEAIIFLTNAQRGKLRLIEKTTKQAIEVVHPPGVDQVNAVRIERFKQRITDVTAQQDLTIFKQLIAGYAEESGKPIELIAAALAEIAQQGRGFLAKERSRAEKSQRYEGDREDSGDGKKRHRRQRGEQDGFASHQARDHKGRDGNGKRRALGPPEPGMQRYRIAVGRKDGVKPGNIVGAVANEAGIDGEFIGPIQIHDSHSTVDLPEGMPTDIYQSLRHTRVVGKQLQISAEGDQGPGSQRRESNGRGHDKSRSKKRHAKASAGKTRPAGKGKKRKAKPARNAK